MKMSIFQETQEHCMVENYHESKVMLQLYLWNIIVWTVIASLKAGLLPASMLSPFILFSCPQEGGLWNFLFQDSVRKDSETPPEHEIPGL